MSWKVTTDNLPHREVKWGYEMDPKVLDEVFDHDIQDKDVQMNSYLEFNGEWLYLNDFPIDLPDELREQGWYGWQTQSHHFAYLLKWVEDSAGEDVPVMGIAEYVS